MKPKIIFLTFLLAVVCTGCGKPPEQSFVQPTQAQTQPTQAQTQPTQAQTEPIPTVPSTEAAGTGNPASGNELFTLAKLNGTVSDFSQTGCTVAPTHEDGDVAAGPAPGYEDSWEQISVVYDSGCRFQYAYSNPQTGEVRYEDASVSDVKKQATIIVWGEYDSGNVVHADRVFLYRMVR